MVTIKDQDKCTWWTTYTIIFRFPWRCNDAIVINCCILYTNKFLYLEKPKDNKEQNALNIDFLGYMSQLKYKLKIEKNNSQKSK